jgi:hypothetical protein
MISKKKKGYTEAARGIHITLWIYPSLLPLNFLIKLKYTELPSEKIDVEQK